MRVWGLEMYTSAPGVRVRGRGCGYWARAAMCGGADMRPRRSNSWGQTTEATALFSDNDPLLCQHHRARLEGGGAKKAERVCRLVRPGVPGGEGLFEGGKGGFGTRPRYLIVCLWRRLWASRHCSL